MTERSLQDFFDTLRSAQQANREKFPDWYQIIERIDGCLVQAGKSLSNPKPVMTGNLLLRCQYGFKTSAALALAGQVPEAFVMQRSVLEYAGYCLTIYEKPELESVFVLRHLGPNEMKEQKEGFKISAVKEVIRRFEPTLSNIFEENYQRSIDFGGHPNPNASFSAAALDERDGEHGMTVLAISDDPQIVKFVLKSTAQVGLTALCILRHVFKDRFDERGIGQEIEALINTGKL